MADPTTSNTGLAIPTRGSDVGTWDSPVNADFSALDGYLGGVQTISLSNSPVTLTTPAGFTPTPSGGPTQAQNAVLRLTGVLSSGVTVTLPLPGYYVVENLTTGNFVVTLRAVTATQVIGIDQGMCQHVYNDGANVRFVNLGKVGQMEFWSGYTAIPAWVTACTVAPYVLCDSSTYPAATYPYLSARYGTNFGGNGSTTVGTPDMRGRVPLAYDGTGGRITVAGCGINGQVLGAAADNQSVTLTTGQIPSGLVGNNSNAPTYVTTQNNGFTPVQSNGSFPGAAVGGPSVLGVNIGSQAASQVTTSFSLTVNSLGIQIVNGGGQSHPNVQPSQVAGIWVVRAA